MTNPVKILLTPFSSPGENAMPFDC